NLIKFGERLIEFVEVLFEQFYKLEAVVNDNILQLIIRSFGVEMVEKHKCYSPSTWKLLARKFIKISKLGLFHANQTGQDCSNICDDLLDYAEPFLLNNSNDLCKLSTESCEESDEIDCQIVELIVVLLTMLEKPPSGFILRSMQLLERGMQVENCCANDFIDTSAIICRRNQFIRKCFQAIIDSSKTDRIIEVRVVAVDSLLRKIKETISKYTLEEHVLPLCMVPGNLSNNVSIMLRTFSDLLRNADNAILSRANIWKSISTLYATLVECTRVTDISIANDARVALHRFQSFLHPTINENT
ncbi:hypothetical protein GJ496_003790, partial [Pomphorhynchus laevis]